MRTACAYLLLIVILYPTLSLGQNYYFDRITELHGLSDNRVTCFMKDRTGFMWIGTENGLNRYDGFEFIIYRPGQKIHNLSHEFINDIEQDADGHLWIGTWNGLNVLDTENDSLFVFSPDDNGVRQSESKIASSITWDIHIDKQHRKWLALDARDLCYYDSQRDEFFYFPWQEYVTSILPQVQNDYKSIQKISRKSENEIWLGTTLGLFSFDIQQQRFQYFGGDFREDFSNMQYDSLGNTLYFAQKRIYSLDIEANKLTRILTDPNKMLPAENYNNPILIPSTEGLWVINPKTMEAGLQTLKGTSPLTLHHAKINSIYKSDDQIWIGTQFGIGLYNQSTDLFPFVRIFPDTSKFVSGNVYYVLDHAKDQKYYISSYTRNSLIVFDKKTGNRKEYFYLDGKPLLDCTRIFEDSKHRLWILSRESVFLSDISHTTFSVFNLIPEGKPYQFVDIAEDNDGNFWIASMEYGVFFYDIKKQKCSLLDYDPNVFFATRPTSILTDTSRREVWIADYSFGAFQYKKDENKYIYHGMDAASSSHMQSSLTYDMTIDKAGNIWIATTSGGVSKYDHAKNVFTTYSMNTGLLENTVQSIQADKNGNIWLAFDKGLTCLQPDGKILKHYNKSSGLPYSNFNTPFSVNQNGELIIGIANGFLKFNPDQLKTTSFDFPIVLTENLQQNNSFKNGAKFNYYQNEMTFEFSALTFALPKQVTYFYKLDGYDSDWINAGNNHSAHYTNLNNGSYTFSVKAIDHNGKSSANIASVSFTIQPPFWKTNWFIALIAVIAASLLYLWYRNLTLKIKSAKTLNEIATSLYGLSTLDEVFWMVVNQSIKLLNFEDCVVYFLQENGVLIQKAKGGQGNKEQFKISSPLEIEIGQGIVGSVAKTGKAEIIRDTSRDPRYIVEDQKRYSEISVPILVEGKVFAVIDSEHSKKNFFKHWHLHMLSEIAKICSAKIGRYFVEESIRSKVARDLHDDIGSTLSSIKIMSNIALEKEDTLTTKSYLKSIRQNANAMQESMSDMVWAINPENDTLEKVTIRMKEFAAELLEPLDILYSFNEDPDFSSTKLSLSIRKDFFLIYKEAINNAAKYSRCKNLTVELKRINQHIHLSIIDNGIGFNPSVQHGGNGLKNMSHRARSIQASIQINSAPQKGTKITLITPIT